MTGLLRWYNYNSWTINAFFPARKTLLVRPHFLYLPPLHGIPPQVFYLSCIQVLIFSVSVLLVDYNNGLFKIRKSL